MSKLVKSMVALNKTGATLAAMQSVALPAEQTKRMRRQAGREPEPVAVPERVSALRGLLHPTERSRYLKALQLERARMRASSYRTYG
jgi:hypothetical protein